MHRTNLFAASAVVLATLLPALAGCSVLGADPAEGDSKEGSSAPGESSTATPKGTKTAPCNQTVCEERTARGQLACTSCTTAASSACMNGVSPVCNASSACESSCSPTICTEAERTACTADLEDEELTPDGERAAILDKTGNVAPEPSLATYLEACGRYIKHVAACGGDTGGQDETSCARWAKVERVEMTRSYDCMAYLPCGASEARCAPIPVSYALDWDRAFMRRCGRAMNGNVIERVVDVSHWLKVEVLEVAEGCVTDAACDDVQPCLTRWTNGLYAVSP